MVKYILAVFLLQVFIVRDVISCSCGCGLPDSTLTKPLYFPPPAFTLPSPPSTWLPVAPKCPENVAKVPTPVYVCRPSLLKMKLAALKAKLFGGALCGCGC